MKKIVKMIQTSVTNKIITIDSPSAIKTAVKQVSGLLRQGEIVIAPTETKYGMLADASNESALTKLFEVKGRPEFMPTAVFLRSVEEIKMYGKLSAKAENIAEEFLPGPLTIVLESLFGDKTYLVNNDKIGIRISSFDFIKQLIDKVDFPVTATSANLSGQADSLTIDQLYKLFGDKVSLYVDGGKLEGEASTVVDASTDELVVLREGAIKTEQLKKYWN